MAKLLILILLVLSPLTFSNNNIPNFTPESPTSVSVRTKAEAAVAFVRTIEPTRHQPSLIFTNTATQLHLISNHSPVTSFFFANSLGRAPPA